MTSAVDSFLYQLGQLSIVSHTFDYFETELLFVDPAVSPTTLSLHQSREHTSAPHSKAFIITLCSNFSEPWRYPRSHSWVSAGEGSEVYLPRKRKLHRAWTSPTAVPRSRYNNLRRHCTTPLSIKGQDKDVEDCSPLLARHAIRQPEPPCFGPSCRYHSTGARSSSLLAMGQRAHGIYQVKVYLDRKGLTLPPRGVSVRMAASQRWYRENFHIPGPMYPMAARHAICLQING